MTEITEAMVERAAAVLSKDNGYSTEGSWHHIYAKPMAREMLAAALADPTTHEDLLSQLRGVLAARGNIVVNIKSGLHVQDLIDQLES